MWRHTFCLWCHQQNFITWIKLYCRFGHVTQSTITQSISVTEVFATSISKGFDQKNNLFWSVVLIQVQWFGTATKYGLEILHQSSKRVEAKSQKVLGLTPTFVEVTEEKHVVGAFLLPPTFLNRANPNLCGLFRGSFWDGGSGPRLLPSPPLSPSCLKPVRIMLETWHLACKYRSICTFRKYTT